MNVTYKVIVWDGKKEVTTTVLYKWRALQIYETYLKCKEAIVVTLRKIEDYGYAVVSSIIKSWEVNGSCSKLATQ